MEFRDYLRALRRAWPMAIVLAIVGASIGAGGALLQKPSYSATADIYISARSATTVGDLSLGATYAEQAADGYAAIATSTYVLKPVIAKLELQTTPAELAKQIVTSTSTTTSVLVITATADEAQQAASIANAIAQQLRAAAAAVTPETTTSTATKTTTTPSVTLTVLDPAVAPTSKTNPSVAVLAAGGAGAGIVLAALLGVLLEVTDTRVRSAEDVQRVTDLPLLGSIRKDARVAKHALTAFASNRSAAAEAYRTLRANLRYVQLDDTARSIVFTSSIEGEGKSVTAANLALAAAGLGQRVVLVDADLRRPRMGDLFGIEDALGLTDVLLGDVQLETAVQHFTDTGLDLLPSGAIPPNPNEQLQSRAMTDLIAELHERYDLVVFDSPPLLPVSDASVLGRQADAVVVVAASGKVRRAQLDEALQALQRVNARIVGVVVTMVASHGGDSYGYGAAYGVNREKAAKPSFRLGRVQSREA